MMYVVHLTLLEVETHFSIIDSSRGRQCFWIHAYPNVVVKRHFGRNANTHYSRIIAHYWANGAFDTVTTHEAKQYFVCARTPQPFLFYISKSYFTYLVNFF